VLAYLGQQARREWRPLPQPVAAKVRVGVMGYGVLGADAAEILVRLGFDVRAWSRSPKPGAVVRVFAGPETLDAFLGETDILVVLLPLTGDTRGILDGALIGRLARDGPLGGPVLINAGRGGLQVSADIDRALRDGVLAGASLDVFETEPLPAESPLWNAPNLVITPHVAADTDPDTATGLVLSQIEAHEKGAPLEHAVDRTRGY
jgi:glyoxylate/hydroxypyruvate reductase A